MTQRLFLLVVFIIGGFSFSGGQALADSTTINVTAVISPSRTIYADSTGNLLSVSSNTPLTVVPTVLIDNRLGELTQALGEQYNMILADNGGNLEAGKTYQLTKQESAKLAAGKAFDASLARLEFD